jgi:hypothetical protein
MDALPRARRGSMALAVVLIWLPLTVRAECGRRSRPEGRQRSEDTFYGSDEWKNGPREAILAAVDNYTTVLVRLDEVTLRGLRNPR